MPPVESPPPPTIPDYELLRLVGRGGYGDVWLARGVTGIYRAIKIVWRERFSEPQPYEREFKGLKEFAAVSLLESRQLALLHVGRHDEAGFFYYVMELADDVETGRDIDPERYVPNTLKAVRSRRGRLPASEVVALGTELARALAGLHARGLVHRDIKPSNIILVGGAPKLADIGLVASASDGLTFVGTEGFVPPEGPGAPAADVFALGKLLYELASGLDRQDYPRLPPDLHTLTDRKALLELNEVLIRACEPRADNRHADASALLDELLLLQAGRSVRRLRAAERGLRRAGRLVAALILVSAVAAVGAWLERQRAESETVLRLQAEAERDALQRRTVYSAQLTQAQRSLEQADYGRARQFLRPAIPGDGEPDLRGFEWRALWSDAQGDPAHILRASGPASQRVCFSAATNLIALCDENHEVTIWDASSRQELRRIRNVARLVNFSTDGRWLIGTFEGRLRRWLVEDGKMDPSVDFAATWAFGPTADDQWLALSLPGGAGSVHHLSGCDFTTGKELWRQTVPFTGGEEAGNYFAAATSPDNHLLAIALVHRDNGVSRWRLLLLSLPEMRILWNETINHRPSVMTFGPRGDTLAVVWDDSGEINLLDVREKKWLWHSRLPMKRLTTLTHDGVSLLAAGGHENALVLLDLHNGKIVGMKHGHELDARSAEFLPGGRLVSTGSGGDVRLWSAPSDKSPDELRGYWRPAGGGRALRLSPDGRLLAATSAPDRVRVTSTVTSQTVAEFDATAPIAFTTDGRHLWTVSMEGLLHLRSLDDGVGTPTRTIHLPVKPRYGDLSTDGRWIACADQSGPIVFYDIARDRLSPVVKSEHDYLYWVAISPDGSRAATSGRDLRVRLWNTATSSMIASWKVPERMVYGAFSPDGSKVAYVQLNGFLEVRTLADPSKPLRLLTTSGILQSLAFHPIERRLFLGGRDGTLLVVDTERWQEITQLPASLATDNPGTLPRIAVSADGTVLAGYTEEGTIRLWRTSPDR